MVSVPGACGKVVHVRESHPKCAKGAIHKAEQPSGPKWGEKCIYSGREGLLPGLGSQNFSKMKSVILRVDSQSMGSAIWGRVAGLAYSRESEHEQSEEGCLAGGGCQTSSMILKSIPLCGGSSVQGYPRPSRLRQVSIQRSGPTKGAGIQKE